MTSSQVPLVVESKLGSNYGDDQIRRYLEWLNTESDRPYRGLLTLTAEEAAWPADDVAFAAATGIVSAARRWADLHVLLEPLTDAAVEGGLAPQLVREFLEMLTDEGLVPVEPLRESELGTAWAVSWDTIRRYRDFFVACRERIGEALGAAPIGSSKYGPGDVFWQDYRFDDGARLGVSIYYTDANSRTPTMFLEARLDHVEDWMETLEENPPKGWTPAPRGWGGERPNVSRPLIPLLSSAPTFEGQGEAIASAVANGRSWIDTALKKGQ